MYLKTVSIFLLFFSSNLLSITIPDELQINIKRIIFWEKYVFILNDSDENCLSAVDSSQINLIQNIIKPGHGPIELMEPADMAINENGLLCLISKRGEFFLYDIKTKVLSKKQMIPIKSNIGNIYKIDFINNKTLFISFMIFNNKILSDKVDRFNPWIMFNISENTINPLNVIFNEIPYLSEIDKLPSPTWLFFTHSIIDSDNVFLTIQGENSLYKYNLKKKKIVEGKSLPIKEYFKTRIKNHPLYGSGIQTPATFTDKGIFSNGKTYFLFGGNEPIPAQLVEIDNALKYKISVVELGKEFSENVNLNSTINNNFLYYWENWNFLSRKSFGFGKILIK